DPDAVAVAGDAGDHAFDDSAGSRAVGTVHRPEAKRIEESDRTSAHRKDVADDPANPGRGALVGLDERRMVVRLDLEDCRVAFADVDRAGVLSRPLDDAR